METKTFDSQTGRFISAVIMNMPEIPSDIMQGWIENPTALKNILTQSLLPPEKWPVWKTITLGSPNTVESLKNSILIAKMHIDNKVKALLNQEAFVICEEPKQIDLIVMSVEQLGLKKGVGYKDVCDRAISRGLELCPVEVGLQLRLQYKDQPPKECLSVATEPLTYNGESFHFQICRDGYGRLDEGGELLILDVSQLTFYYRHERFVFALPGQ
jgi:hypothetical protein